MVIATGPELDHDLRTVAEFVELYCHRKHRGAVRERFDTKVVDVDAVLGRRPVLCGECTRLLLHAVVKRLHCPMVPKPACKHCPRHCYHPRYRQRMREVMRFSGTRLLLSGRLRYLTHLLL
ncbi:MAG: nitrous oxide-stimulated promoter family protein [Planctomycetota bacterium]|nr:MAG: nitrous oxide-stimulated promoter family protein [Planctomycetota bacterium]